MKAAIVDIGAGQQRARTHQLQMQPRRSGPPHVGQPGGNDFRGPGQLSGAKRCRLRGEAFRLIGSHIDQPGCQRIRYGSDDHKVTEPA